MIGLHSGEREPLTYSPMIGLHSGEREPLTYSPKIGLHSGEKGHFRSNFHP